MPTIVCDIWIWTVALACKHKQEWAFHMVYYDYISCDFMFRNFSMWNGICVFQIQKIIVHAFCCHESIEWIICSIFVVAVQLYLFCKMWHPLYIVISELLIVITSHVFHCLRILIVRWYVCVSMWEIIVHVLNGHNHSMNNLQFSSDVHLHYFARCSSSCI